MSITASAAASLNVSTVSTPVAVSDSAANVAINLDSLHNLAAAHKLASIRLSDAGTPSITTTAAKLISDSDALLLVSNTTWTIALSGSASVAQAVGANSTLAAKLSTGFAISDTAANVASNLDNLQSRATTIASVALSDISPSLSMTAAQIVADSLLLLKIGGTYGIVVTGFATAAQAAAVRNPLIVKLTRNLNVSDSAANVASSLNGLQAHLNWVGSIALTDSSPVLTLTNAQFFADAGALLKISRSFGITLSDTATVAQVLGANVTLVAKLSANFAISDTAANIGGAIDALQSHIGTIRSVVLTDASPVVSLTSVQVLSDAGLLLKIGGSFGITVSNAATAAQVAAMDSKLTAKLTGGLAVSDSATALSGALSTLTGLGNRLGSVTVVGPATVAQALTIFSALSRHLSGTVAVSDIGSSVLSGMSDLLAAIGKIGTITVTDAPLTLTAAAAEASGVADANGVISKITGHAYNVTGALVSDLSTLNGLPNHPTGITLSDTASAIAADLASVSSKILTAAGQITAITVGSGGPLSLSVAVAEATGVADANGVISKITGHAYNVTGALVSDLSTLNGLPNHPTGITLSDTASVIAADLASVSSKILTAAGQITAITVSSGGPLSLSVAAAEAAGVASSSGVISKITGHAYNVTGALVSDLSTLNGLPNHPTGITLSDTASVIAADLASVSSKILTAAGQITAITIGSGGPLSLSVAVAEATGVADANGVISKITGHAYNVTGALVSDLSTLNGLPNHPTGITLSDTASVIAADLASVSSKILTAAGQITAITVSSGGPLSLSVAAAEAAGVASSSGVISKITGHAYNVTGALVSDLSTLNGLPNHPTGITLSDTASVIAADLASVSSKILTAAGQITAITVSSGGPLSLSVAAAEAAGVASSSGVISKITGHAYNVTGALVSDLSTLNTSAFHPTGITLSDTASAIATDLASVSSKILTAAGQITAITVSSGAPLTLSVAAAEKTGVADAGGVISKITGHAYNVTGALVSDLSTLNGLPNHPTGITLSDTASHIAADLASVSALIVTNLSQITAIAISDGNPLVVTVATLGSAVFNKIASYTLTVSDTGSNVSGILDTLQTLGNKVGSISLIGVSPVLSVTANQLINDAATMLKIGGSYHISVSGNATAAQATTANTTLVSYLSTGFTVSDSVTNIGTQLDALQILTAATQLVSITATGGTISISATQLVNDSSTLALISGGYSLTITSGTLTAAQATGLNPSIIAHLSAALPVSDTSTNIVSYLGGLQAIAGSVLSVAFTDTMPTLSLTATQITDNISILAHASGYTLSVSGGTFTAAQAVALSGTAVAAHLAANGVVVVDTAAHVSGALDALATLAGIGKLGPITLNDASVLPVTPDQLLADLAVFRKITNNYTFSVSPSLTADQAASVSALLTVRLPASLVVSDTSSHVIADLDALEALALGHHLQTVTLTDGGTPQLNVTADQLTSDADALRVIGVPYHLVTTGGITAAQAASYAGQMGKLGAAVSVLDSAAAIASNLPNLSTLAAANPSLLSAITFTDVGTPTLSMSASVFTNSGPALMKIGSSYNVTIASGTLTTAQVATAAAQGVLSHVTGGFTLSDTASAIANDLALVSSKILTAAGQITAITVSSGAPLTLSVAAAEKTGVADTGGVISKITGNAYNVTGALVSDLSTLNTSAFHPTGITLSDTASAIANDLALVSSKILTAAGQITAITVSSGAPLTLSVAAAEKTGVADTGGVISKITGNAYNVTGALVSDLSTLNTSAFHPTGITLSDTATAIANDLALVSSKILTAAGQITAITVSSGAPLTLSVAAAEKTGVADTGGVISKITGNAYNVTGALVSDLSTLNTSAFHPTGITLSDTATAIANDLALVSSKILTAAGQITAITVSSGAPLTLSVAAAEKTGVADTGGVISKITGNAYNVTGALVSDLSTLNTSAFHPTGITLSDTASAIAADLALVSSKILTAAGQITAITVSSGAPLTLSVAAAEKTGVADTGGVISKITGNAYNVTGALVSDLSTLNGLPNHPTGITLSDTASAIANDLALVSSKILTAAGQITAITVSSGAPLTLSVAAAEKTGVADTGGVISKITGNAYNVTGALVSDLSTLNTSAFHPTGITLSDTATAIANDLALVSSKILTAAGQITAITVSSGAPLTLSVAAAEKTGVADTGGVISKITGNAYNVTGALVSDLSTLNTSAFHPTGITLSDTASAIANDLALVSSKILTAAGQITAITVSSGAPLTLSVAAAEKTGVADIGGVISKITGNAYNVTGALVSDLSTLNTSAFHPTGITLSDTATAIANDLALVSSKILTAAGQITAITVSSGAPLTLSVAAAEKTGVADTGGVISKITGNAYNVTGALVSDLSTLNTSAFHPTGITLSDTATAIANDLALVSSKILTAAGQITAITVSSGAPLTLSVAAAEKTGVADTGGVISKITGNAYNVTGALVSDLSTLNGLPNHPTGITLSDTASAIATDLALGTGSSAILTAGNQITAITVSDSNPLVASSGMLDTDAAVFSKIASYTLTVSDTAANVSSHLPALQALGTKLASIALSGSPSTFLVTATQLSQYGGALSKIVTGGVRLVADGVNTSLAATAASLSGAPAYSGTLLFSDNVANVYTNLGALQALAATSNLGTITVTGGGTISLSAGDLLADSGALALISGSYSLTIASGTLTAAQATGLSPSIIAHLSAALPVSDTSTNIVSYLGGLQAIAGSVLSVAFTDTMPTLSLTATQITDNINILAKTSGYNLSVSGGAFTAAQAVTLSTSPVKTHLAAAGAVVVDTAAYVSGALASLMTLAGIGKLGPITLNDVSVLPVTPDQLLNDLAVFRKITNNYTFSVSPPLTADQAASVSALLTARLPANLVVSDTSSHVIADLDALEALALGSHLGTVTLTDGGTPQLNVTADQLTSDADALRVIGGTYQLVITGSITAAEAASYAGQMGKLGAAVSVLDSAAAIASNLANLGTLAGANPSLLSAITFTDIGTPTLSITASIFASGGPALMKIGSNYNVTITSGGPPLTTAQVATAATQGVLSHVTGGITLSDTSAHIAADLALGGSSIILTAAGQISAITVSDSPLSLTVAQAETAGVATAGGVISKIGSHAYNVTGALVSDLGTLNTPTYHPTAITLSDTSAHIAADLALGGSSIILTAAGQISAITVSDSPLSLTVAQAETAGVATAGGVISKIGSHAYNVTGALVSDLGTLNTPTYHPTAITLSDTSAHIAADLALGGSSTILTAAGQISAITVSDSPLSLTVAQAETAGVATAGGVISKIGSHAYNVTGALVSDLGTLNTPTYHPTAITLSDTSAHIAADLALGGSSTILTAAGQISAITVSDSPLSLTVAQAETAGVATAGGVISKIGSHAYNVTGALVSDLGTLNTPTYHPTAITLSDTSAHIAADLALGGSSTILTAAGQISAITVSDSPLSLTVAQAETAGVATAGGVISKIGSHAYNVTGALVSDLGTLNTPTYHPTAITLSDTSAHIAADLALGGSSTILTAAGQISAITVSDSPLSLTVAQAETAGVATAGGVISKIGSHAYNVTGALVSDLGTLNTPTYHPTAITLSDTSAHIAADLALGGSSTILTAAGQISAITVSDSPLSLTVAQAETAGVATAGGVISKIGSHAYNVTGALVSDLGTLNTPTYHPTAITLSDTSAHIAADLALGGSSTILTAAGQISAITVSDSPLSLTVAQAETAGVATAGGVISKIGSHAYNVTGALVSDLGTLNTPTYHPTAITLSDTSAHIAADLALGGSSTILTAAGQISAITVSDSPLSLTVAQAETAGVATAGGVISKIGSHAYNVTGALVSDLGTLNTPTYHPTAITLSDTSAHIAADLALGGSSTILTAAGQISAITVSDSPLSLTVAQAETAGVATAGGVISKIGSHAYNVTGALVSDLGTLNTPTYHPTAITLSDTSAHIAADLALGGSSTILTAAGQISAITVSDSPLSLTVAQAETAGVATAGGVISKIGSHAYNVTGALVSDLGTLNTPTYHPTAITLSDTSAHIAADLALGGSSTILTAAGQISAITVSDSPLSLTVAQAETAGVATAGGVISKIGSHAYNVTGALVSDLGTLNTPTYHPTAITLSDTSAHIAADLALGGSSTILTAAGQISAITVSDSPLSLTVAQAETAGVATAGGVISKIGSHAYNVTGALVSDLGTLNTPTYHPTAITLSDTSAHIAADLALGGSSTILTAAGQINTVTATGSVTAAQAVSIQSALTTHISGTINVNDTASGLMADLTGLQTLASATHLGTITMTSPVGAYSVTVAQASADPLAINAIAGATGAKTNAVLYVQATSSSDNSIDLSSLTHVTDVSLYTNTATMSFMSGTAASITGTQNQVTLNPATGAGAVASTIEYSSGVEVINNFQFGLDTLNFALGSYGATLTATDLTSSDVALTITGAGTSSVAGVILRGIGSAATVTNHLFAAGNHAIIT